MNEAPVTAPSSSTQESARKKWLARAGWILGTVAILYGMVYVDVLLRAKESYQEAEKHMRWHERPEEKKSELERKLAAQKAGLEKKLSANKIKKEAYERELEILQFDFDRQMEESSVKYAYVWYKTAYELFSPPESKWVKLSRQKAPLAKEKWKEELRAKNIPFEEYMLD